MNEKIRPDEFRKSMDRCLSGVKADPFLAGRVLASKERETKVKRKLSASLVFALVALLALGTAAYSASYLYRSVNMKGEVVTTELPYDMDDFFYGSGMNAKETRELVNQTAHDVPDDIYCQAWYSSPKDHAAYISTHQKTKKVNSYEEFLEYMSGTDHLTLPTYIPENYTSFSAEIYMDCAWDSPLELLEENTEGPVQYVRYTFDESASVISGYSLVFGYEDHNKDIQIVSSLTGSVPATYGLTDNEKSDPVTVKGMGEALLLSRPGYFIQIHMQRYFDRIKHIHIHVPEKANTNPSDNGYYRHEYVVISSRDRKPEELLKVFNGE